MAQDNLLFKPVAAVHPRFRTPGRAIALQGIWAAVLVWTGTYRELVSRVIYTEWIFFGLLAVGVILLRRRADYAPQWRMPGVPLIPILFALFSFAIALNEIVSNFWNASIGLAMVLAGLPVYWMWLSARRPVSRRHRPSARPSRDGVPAARVRGSASWVG